MSSCLQTLEAFLWCVLSTLLTVTLFFSSRSRHRSSLCDWSSDVCSSDLESHAIISANPDDNYVAIRLRQYNTRRAELDTLLHADHALELQVAAAEAEGDAEARQRGLLRIDRKSVV